MKVSLFFRRVFGGVRFFEEWLFFAWSVALGKILAMDNLRKQNLIVVDWSCMHKKSEEIVDHLLRYCEVIKAL